MSHNFAEVVVKVLSPAEKERLHEILKTHLIEERQRETLENHEAGVKEMRNGELTST